MRSAVLTFITALGTFSATGLLAQQAGQADYAKLISVVKQTCLATFPEFTGPEPKLRKLEFSPTGDGAWISDDVFFRSDPKEVSKGDRTCQANLRMKSRTKAVSDVLQAQLPALGLQNVKATRKGVRLSAAFAVANTQGTLRVSPLGGYTASVVVAVKSE